VFLDAYNKHLKYGGLKHWLKMERK